MDIQIKNLKIANFASDDTLCFQASLYLDGKRAGTVSNDGHGGPNAYDFINKADEPRFFNYCDTVTEKCDCADGFGKPYYGKCPLCNGVKEWKPGPDSIIDNLVAAVESDRADKKQIAAFKRKGYLNVVCHKLSRVQTQYVAFLDISEAEKYAAKHGKTAMIIAGG